MRSLTAFLEITSLDGLTFLDIGCGSGLFSLAAHRLGAKKIVSFDLDPDSVSCCEYLKEKEDNPALWSICRGSILDDAFISALDRADIVYSWGVLHHTNSMWKAIENSIRLVRPGGVFFIAIYNEVHGLFGSKTWLLLKRLYNRVSRPLKTLMEYSFITMIIAKMILTLRNPYQEISQYKKRRGMSFMTDIRDSLGGYPYEFASAEEVVVFCRKFGLALERITPTTGLGCNEFLFRNVEEGAQTE